jgi:hypothetical protein
MTVEPISLSDDALATVMRLCEPLAPHDRVAFMHSLAQLLRQEPERPPGDGIVHRHARQLLATGHYSRSSAVTVGAASARHQPAARRRASGA